MLLRVRDCLSVVQELAQREGAQNDGGPDVPPLQRARNRSTIAQNFIEEASRSRVESDEQPIRTGTTQVRARTNASEFVQGSSGTQAQDDGGQTVSALERLTRSLERLRRPHPTRRVDERAAQVVASATSVTPNVPVPAHPSGPTQANRAANGNAPVAGATHSRQVRSHSREHRSRRPLSRRRSHSPSRSRTRRRRHRTPRDTRNHRRRRGRSPSSSSLSSSESSSSSDSSTPARRRHHRRRHH